MNLRPGHRAVPDQSRGPPPRLVHHRLGPGRARVPVCDRLRRRQRGRAGVLATRSRPAQRAAGGLFRWKLLRPLLIVRLLGCSVPVVHPRYADVRLAGPATALLTLVFLQQGSSETLPETGGLVLLDKISVLADAVVRGLIGVTILPSHWMREGAAQAARARRLDRLAAGGLFARFLAGTLILRLPVR